MRDSYNNYYVAPTYYSSTNYYAGNLAVSCSANLTSVIIGGDVTWTAYATGGTGSYTYTWTGTDNLGAYRSAYLNTLMTRYNDTGTKYATVTVRSGSQTVVQLCGNSVFVRFPTAATTAPARQIAYVPVSSASTAKQPLDVTCVANTANAQLGDNVVWTAQVTGGTSTSYSYSWQGSDGLFGLNNTVFKSYSMPGVKMAAVSVTSGKDTITKQCMSGVSIGDVNQNVSQAAAAKFSLDQIPWGLVSVLIILILAGSLIYVLATRPPRA